MVSAFISTFVDLIGQLTFGIAILAVSAEIARRSPIVSPPLRQVGIGVTFGFQAVVSILIPAVLPQGVAISTASASVALGGLFGGWIGGLVSFAIVTIVRLGVDHAVINGIVRTGACALAGVILAGWVQRKRREIELTDLAVLSVAVPLIAMVSIAFASSARQQVLIQALFPLTIALVSGVLLLGGQYLGQVRRRELVGRLAASEARMRDVLNNLPGTVYQMRLNSDGTTSYLFASDGITVSHGISGAQMVADARLVDSTFLPEEEEGRRQYLRESAISMKPGRREFRMRRPDGSIRWLRTHSTPAKDDHGQIVWTGFTLDITEDRRKDEELRKSAGSLAANERQLRGIFASVPGVVYQICRTPDGNITYKFISDGVRALFGVEPEAALKDPWVVWNTYLPEDEPDRLRALKESAETLTRRERVFRIRRPDGAIRWVHSFSTPRRGANGETYWDGVTLDITAEKEMEAALAASERQVQSIVASVPGIVYRTLQTPDGTVRFLFMSDGVRTMFGISPEAAMQDASVVTETFIPDDEPARQQFMQQALQTSGLREREFRMRRSDGSIRWLQSRSTPHPQPNGDIIWDGVTLDITDLKEMEEALRRALSETAASEERMRAIIGSVPGVVYQIRYGADGSSKYTFLSEGVRDLIGYSAAEAIADQSLIHNSRLPDEEPDRMRTVEESKANMSLRVREFRGRHRDGSLRWFHSRSVPHLSSSGDMVWDGITMDITDRKRLEEEVRRSEHMLALGGLVDGVAHNFNNLLQIVSGAAELLLDTLRDHPDRAVADQILNATHRGSRLVNELRRFSLRQPAAAQQVDVNLLLTDMRDLASHFVGSNVTVELTTDPVLWPVEVNPTRLQSMILSLVLNARDAMPQGGTVRLETQNVQLGEVEARAIERAPGPYVRIRVADTGVGMSPQVLKRATEPFFTTKPANQVGMGLSTVLAFVAQLGGRLSLKSEQGVGTEVTLHLPAQRTVEGEVAVPAPNEQARNPANP